MGDKEEREENTPRGNEWEVVSLTASAYAAAPGSKGVEMKNDYKDNTYDEAETSHALFMSDHFVFPPSEHENLPLDSFLAETREEKVKKDAESEFGAEQETGSNQKDDGDLSLKGLNLPDEFTGTPFFDEKSNKEHNVYGTSKIGSLHGEKVVDGSTTGAYDDESHIFELKETIEGDLDFTADASCAARPAKDDKSAVYKLPCEAWWRRRAASLYANAKEANAFWSIFVAAAVMGLVILGQHWQQERWQALQLKWQSSINSEETSRMLGPISRLKDVIVGGSRRGSFIRASSPSES